MNAESRTLGNLDHKFGKILNYVKKTFMFTIFIKTISAL